MYKKSSLATFSAKNKYHPHENGCDASLLLYQDIHQKKNITDIISTRYFH